MKRIDRKIFIGAFLIFSFLVGLSILVGNTGSSSVGNEYCEICHQRLDDIHLSYFEVNNVKVDNSTNNENFSNFSIDMSGDMCTVCHNWHT